MSIFNLWQSKKDQRLKAAEVIREQARHLVESGGISIEEASRAISVTDSFTPGGESGHRRMWQIMAYPDKAKIDRKHFQQDARGLNEADLIFVDELRKLVGEFDKDESKTVTGSKPVAELTAAELKAEIGNLSEQIHERIQLLEKLQPPKPTPAATKATTDAVDARIKEHWKQNLGGCRERFPSFTAFEAMQRYQADPANADYIE